MVEQSATEQGCFGHEFQFVVIFDPAQGLDERCRERDEESPPQLRRQGSADAREVGYGGVSWVESDEFDPALRGKPDGGIVGGWAGDNLHLGSGDFGCSLCGVAAIGKEPRGAARNSKGCAGTGESAEIANIGQMGNKETMQARAGNTAAHKTDTAVVVHSGQDISRNSTRCRV